MPGKEPPAKRPDFRYPREERERMAREAAVNSHGVTVIESGTLGAVQSDTPPRVEPSPEDPNWKDRAEPEPKPEPKPDEHPPDKDGDM